MKKIVKSALSLIFVCTVFISCANSENDTSNSDAHPEEYMEWINKFFYFDFQGNEVIETQYYGINATAIAKITLPEEDEQAFLQTALEKAANKYTDFESAYYSCFYSLDNNLSDAYPEKLDEFHSFIDDFNEETFDYVLINMSTATYTLEEETVYTSRMQHVIVLEPYDGYVTIFAIATFVNSE